MEKKDITLKEIQDAFHDLMDNPMVNEKHRKLRLVTCQGGYDLFCKAMEEAGVKFLNQNKQNG